MRNGKPEIVQYLGLRGANNMVYEEYCASTLDIKDCKTCNTLGCRDCEFYRLHRIGITSESPCIAPCDPVCCDDCPHGKYGEHPLGLDKEE